MGRSPTFIVQEKHRGRHAKSVKIEPIVIDRMIGQRRFNLGKIALRLSSKLAVSEIFFSVMDGGLFTISRFPRSLLEDEGVRESMYRDYLGRLSNAVLVANSIRVIIRNPPDI